MSVAKLFNLVLLEVSHQTMATKAATGKKRMTQSEVINHFAE